MTTKSQYLATAKAHEKMAVLFERFGQHTNAKQARAAAAKCRAALTE